MKITRVSYERLELTLAAPYTIAYETIAHATNFVLKVETDTAHVGYGCAAPDPVVTGETAETVAQAIHEPISALLPGERPGAYARLLEELTKVIPTASSARAMVDMALLDLLAKQAKVPLYQLLGGYREHMITSVTIGIMSLNETMALATRYVEEGFLALKLKGGLNVDEDITKIKRLHTKFPRLKLRFDANQGYTVGDTVAFAQATEHVGVEMIEQPLAVAQEQLLDELLPQVRTPIMVDEGLKTLDDALRLTARRRTDMLNVKLMKVGGITEAMSIQSVAQAARVPVMIGCVDECALGIAAGLHVALSRPIIKYADLDGHLDFVNDPFRGLFHLKQGVLYPTDEAGLGKISL